QPYGRGTGDVRGRHRRTGDGVGGGVAAVPRRGDGGARGEQVEHRAVVGEAGAGVAGRGRADGDRLGDARGRVVGGVGAVVARGDREGHPGGDGVAYGRVEGGVCAAAEGHVGDGGAGVVAGDPVDAG